MLIVIIENAGQWGCSSQNMMTYFLPHLEDDWSQMEMKLI